MMLFPTQFHSSLRCSALPRFNTLKYSRVRVSLTSIRIERRLRRLRRKLDMLGKVQATQVRKILMMKFLDSENEIVDGYDDLF
jgi:hypothetical protein